jgi:Zn ribbon nucleic-acid-binding protein
VGSKTQIKYDGINRKGGKMLSKEAKKKYIKGGYHCPYCESENIEARGDKDVEYDGNEIRQLVECLNCGKGWYDLYKLTKIVEIEDISLDELADEVVLPEMLVYPGDKLDFDFIFEKSYHADHRANKENVRGALKHLVESGDVIESNNPEHWIAIIQH